MIGVARDPLTRTGRSLALRWGLPVLLVGLSGCGDDPADPAEAGPAQLAIVADFPANAVGEGALRAFDASDVLSVRILAGTTVRYEREIPVSPSGQDVRTPVELEVRRGGETLTLELQLRSAGAPLFDGGAAVTLRRGETTPARVVLDPVVAGLTVSPTQVSLDAYGEASRITAIPLFATGDPIDGLAVEWSTMDEGVARVDGSGAVTGVADGSTRVVATLAGRTASAQVDVFAVISTLTIDPPVAEIPLGSDVRFTALLADRNGNAIVGRTVEWSSSDASLIEVAGDGTAVARGIGLANIRAVSGEAAARADARGIPIPPQAGVRRAAPLDPRTLEVVGGIRPNGLPTTAQVEWAIDEEFTTGVGRSMPESLAAGVDEVVVTIRPSGFLPGTLYYGRILVENGVGAGESEVFVFTMPIALPAGETGDPTSVTGGGATLGGRVDTGGGQTRVRFQISRTEDFREYREIDGGVLPPGSSIQDVQVPVDGLDPGTFYCVRIVATNEAGETFGEPVCFVTPGPPPPPPPPAAGVTTLAASDVTATTARLNGSVQAGTAAEVWFEWGTSPSLASAAATPRQPVPAGAALPAAADLPGLTPETIYYFRAVLLRDGALRRGSILAFTTTADGGGEGSPTAGSTSVSAIGATTATFTAGVTPGEAPTQAWFEWSTDAGFGTVSRSAAVDVGAGGTSVPVVFTATGLSAGTTYYVRLVAENASGVSRGPATAFPTGAGGSMPPVVETRPPWIVDTTTLKLVGTVNPNGLATVAWFEWSTDPDLSGFSRTPDQSVGDGTGAALVYQSLGGLSPGTTYYLRIAASNADGTTRGEIVGFTLP